jgi:hypothetical protein
VRADDRISGAHTPADRSQTRRCPRSGRLARVRGGEGRGRFCTCLFPFFPFAFSGAVGRVFLFLGRGLSLLYVRRDGNFFSFIYCGACAGERGLSFIVRRGFRFIAQRHFCLNCIVSFYPSRWAQYPGYFTNAPAPPSVYRPPQRKSSTGGFSSSAAQQSNRNACAKYSWPGPIKYNTHFWPIPPFPNLSSCSVRSIRPFSLDCHWRIYCLHNIILHGPNIPKYSGTAAQNSRGHRLLSQLPRQNFGNETGLEEHPQC